MAVTSKPWRIIVAFVLVALVASAFIGCLGNQGQGIERIQDRGRLIIGTSSGFPPFEMINTTSGDVEGIDIDIARAIAESLNVTLEVQDLGFDVLVGSVTGGSIDMALAGMTITAERNESVTFSNPYYSADQAILVAADDTTIAGPDDLEGLTIAVNTGTTGDFWVADNLVAEGLVDEADVSKFDFASDAILALTTGSVDAVIIDDAVARNYVELNPDDIKVADVIVTNEFYGIAMNKGDTDLIQHVNELLAEMEASGD